jgi:hypothetical protein
MLFFLTAFAGLAGKADSMQILGLYKSFLQSALSMGV